MNIKITDVRGHKGDAAFLIDDGKTSILYDTGFGFTGYAIADNIKKALGERELDYIFLTHSHYDHALGSAYILRRYPTAKVVAGRYTADIFCRDGAKKVMQELDSKFAQKCGVTDYEFLGDELKVDVLVDDGDIIHAGDMDFRVISLPGHTRCCIGFYCEKEKLLLSCETLGVYVGGETIMPICLVSFSDAIASIEKIEKLNISSVLAPHWGLLDKEQTKFYIENMKNAVENITQSILNRIKMGCSDEEIVQWLKNKFWCGHVREIYPEDAATLNNSIMVRLARKELL